MTKYAAIFLLALLLSLPARAVSPVGEWRVKDGSAHIRILTCDEKLWGVISWEKSPGTDTNNPDASKRGLPVLGLPILLGMQPDGESKWSGRIYNADNGKIYEGGMTLAAPDVLHVNGCLLYGVLCGGEDWTRVAAADAEGKSKCSGIKERSPSMP